MMQYMSATGKPEDWDQPNGFRSLNLDDIFLTGLGETHEQGLSNVSRTTV